MNLKNNYLLKKLLKWANKKQNNFNIYNAAFKKNKEKYLGISLFYTCVPKISIISSTYVECCRLKLVILGHLLPFCPPKNPKNQNFEKMKKLAGDIIILHITII